MNDNYIITDFVGLIDSCMICIVFILGSTMLCLNGEP